MPSGPRLRPARAHLSSHRLALVGAAIAIGYAGTLGHGFHFDDFLVHPRQRHLGRPARSPGGSWAFGCGSCWAVVRLEPLDHGNRNRPGTGS